MIQQNIKEVFASDYFAENDFAESRLLNLNYQEQAAVFKVVLSYTLTPSFSHWLQTGEKLSERSPHDFRRLSFKDVFNFKATDRRIRNNNGEIFYQEKEGTGVLLLQQIKFEQGEKKWIELYCFSDTKCEFNFKDLYVERRLAKSEKNEKGKLDYFDLETGEEFDPYFPFGK